MANPSARRQHDPGKTSDRDLRPGTIGIHGYEGTIQNIELGAFDEYQRSPIL